MSIKFPECKFNDLKSIKDFCNMTKTDIATWYYNNSVNNIKIIGKEQDIYFFCEVSKLWLCLSNEKYVGQLAKYFNTVGKILMHEFKMIKLLKKTEDDDDDDNEEIKKLNKKVNKMCGNLDTSSYLKTIIERSTGFLQQNDFVVLLNSNPDYLPIKNGNKICLKDGTISPRTKEDYFSFECDVDFVDNTPNADKFFSQVMPNEENREYLRQILGYTLTGNMDARAFFVLYGKGANGKTVIMNLLQAILKALYHQCSKGIFMKTAQEKCEGASPDKMALMGVRCAVYSEGESSDNIELNESFIKMISGKDPINARALFRAPITFLPMCKMFLLTNYKPDPDGDDSIRDRLHYIFLDSRFYDNPKNEPNHFKKDDEFVENLKTIYLSEVFSWMVKGAIEYYKTKTLTKPQEFTERTNILFNQTESITAFLQNKIQKSDKYSDYIRKNDMVELYHKYCDANSLRMKVRSTLFKRLEDENYVTSELHGIQVYRNVKIIDHTAPTEEDEKRIKEEESLFEDKAVYIRAEEHKKVLDKIELLREEMELYKGECKDLYKYVAELEQELEEEDEIEEEHINEEIELEKEEQTETLQTFPDTFILSILNQKPN